MRLIIDVDTASAGCFSIPPAARSRAVTFEDPQPIRKAGAARVAEMMTGALS